MKIEHTGCYYEAYFKLDGYLNGRLSDRFDNIDDAKQAIDAFNKSSKEKGFSTSEFIIIYVNWENSFIDGVFVDSMERKEAVEVYGE